MLKVFYFKEYIKRFVVTCLLLASIVSTILLSGVHVYADATEDYRLFSQTDARWGGYIYGGGCSIANYGCYIVSFACLMAYANPDLRDVNTFNPQVFCTKASFQGGGLNQYSINNVDSTVTWVNWTGNSNPGEFKNLPVEEKEAIIKEHMDKGEYVVVRATQPIAYKTWHFSPITGWDEENDKPILLDVCNRRDPTWDEWAPYVDRIEWFSSTVNKSYDVLETDPNYQEKLLAGEEVENGNSNSTTQLTEEEASTLEDNLGLIPEHAVDGMPDVATMLEYQDLIDFPEALDLSFSEQVTVAELGESIRDTKDNFPELFNIFISFIGILLIIYSIILIISALFDYANNFLEISLVHVLTLGKLQIVSKDFFNSYSTLTKSRTKYITVTGFMFRMCLLVGCGILVLSGFVQEILVWVSRLINVIF